jgi:hypothetical protein
MRVEDMLIISVVDSYLNSLMILTYFKLMVRNVELYFPKWHLLQILVQIQSMSTDYHRARLAYRKQLVHYVVSVTGWSPVQGSLTDCLRIKELKWKKAFHGCPMLQVGSTERRERESSLSEVMQPMKQLPLCYRHFSLLFYVIFCLTNQPTLAACILKLCSQQSRGRRTDIVSSFFTLFM